MRISSIANMKNIQNFSGERILQKTRTKFYERNEGCLDDWTKSAPPKCTFYEYIYHPFKGESMDSIEDALSEGNFSYRCQYDENRDKLFYESSITRLGKTLPFTEKEWKNLDMAEREDNLKILENK